MTLPIVERLRARKLTTGNVVGSEWIKDDADCTEAADTIEELTEQNRRVKLVMGGALTMLAGYDADAANELRAALNKGDA